MTEITDTVIAGGANPSYVLLVDYGTTDGQYLSIAPAAPNGDYGMDDGPLQALVEEIATSLASSHTIQLIRTAEASSVIQVKYAILDDVESGGDETGWANHVVWQRDVSQPYNVDVNNADNYTFHVTLSDAPAANTTVYVDAGGGMSVVEPSSGELVFTSANYNVPQTVTLSMPALPPSNAVIGIVNLSVSGSSYNLDQFQIVYVAA